MTSTAPDSLGKGTLGRKLVIQVGVLVAIGTVLLGVIMSVATYQVLVSEIDQRLNDTYARIKFETSDKPGGIGLQTETVVAAFSGAHPVSQVQLTKDGWVSLSDESATLIHDNSSAQNATSITLPDIGLYRFRSYPHPNGVTVVIGLPMASLIQTMTRLIVLQTVFVITMVTVSALAARVIVQRSLRPLNRLASAATTVSQLSLDRGEVSIAERVTENAADPHTEVGRVGAAFNLMLDNVENALAVRQDSETKVRQFVADASHELRNPLASIRGYAELTRREREAVPPQTRQALERIESESDRMSVLVNDMLLLARLDADPTIEMVPVDASEIVVNAVNDARVAGHDHEWTFTVPDEPVIVAADPHRLHQVVVNLLTNARTHTPAGTKVHASVDQTSEAVEIRITDNGPGISPEILGSVFERFVRAETSRVRTSGSSTGLGLAIVKAVILAHHGQVSAESEPGQRTSFLITLPLYDSSNSPDTKET